MLCLGQSFPAQSPLVSNRKLSSDADPQNSEWTAGNIKQSLGRGLAIDVREIGPAERLALGVQEPRLHGHLRPSFERNDERDCFVVGADRLRFVDCCISNVISDSIH